MDNKILYILGLLLVISTSCVSKRPFASSVSNPDYNQRVTVKNPGFVKKENKIGLSVSLGLTALAGYMAYDKNLIKPHSPDGENSTKIGGALVGAMATFALTRIVTKYAGINRKYSVTSQDEWIKSLKNDYRMLDSNGNDEYLIMNRAVETNYKVKDFNDILDFKKAFPISIHSDKILSKSLYVVDRSQIPLLLEMYPNAENRGEIKMKFFSLSQSVKELKEANDLYPEIASRFDLCNLTSSLLSSSSSVSDYAYILKKFPDINCFYSIKNKFFSSLSNVNDCKSAIYLLPEFSDEIIEKAMNISSTIEDYYEVSKFKGKEKEAEKKAFLLANTLKKQKEFIKYFDKGIYYNEVKSRIDREYSFRREVKIKLYDFVQNEGLRIARKVSSFNIYNKEDITITTISEPIFEDNKNKMEGDYEVNWTAEYNDIGDNGGINLLERGVLALVVNNTAPLKETKTVPMSVKGKLNYDRKTGNISFKPYYYSKYVEKSRKWKNDAPIYLGTIAMIGAVAYETGKYAAKKGWLDQDYSYEKNKEEVSNTEKMHELSKGKKVDYFEKLSTSKDITGITIVSYKVHLKKAGHIFVDYYPNSDSWHFHNGWNEKNRGKKFYKTKAQIINRIENE